MAFAYIDAKHPEVLVPPTASEHMQSVMQRHPNQSKLDWRKWIVKHPQKYPVNSVVDVSSGQQLP